VRRKSCEEIIEALSFLVLAAEAAGGRLVHQGERVVGEELLEAPRRA
jgi:hypothetical protein